MSTTSERIEIVKKFVNNHDGITESIKKYLIDKAISVLTSKKFEEETKGHYISMTVLHSYHCNFDKLFHCSCNPEIEIKKLENEFDMIKKPIKIKKD